MKKRLLEPESHIGVSGKVKDCITILHGISQPLKIKVVVTQNARVATLPGILKK